MIEVRNPYTRKLIKKVPCSPPREIASVVQKAKKAFQASRTFSSEERYTILKNTYEKLVAHKKKMARLISEETGKTLRESSKEVDRASFLVSQCAEESLRMYGEVIPCDVTKERIQKKAIVSRQPLGVIGAITPFNFPLNICAHKVCPAIATGNTVVLKPSPFAPLTALFFRELMIKSGLPKDMFGIVQGYREVAEQLVLNEDIRMVTFTGGTQAGKSIANLAGSKKLSLELGGNSALIVMDDADLDAAVNTSIDHRFFTAGQRCTAAKRLFLHSKIYNQFKKKLIAKTKKLKVGNPMNPKVDIGPVISEKAAELTEERVKDATKKGARVVLAQKRKRNVFYPTILEKVPENCSLIKEETFGPVLPLFSFSKIDEVIKKVNRSRFGLQAGVYTEKLSVIKELNERLEVGTLIVNGGPGFRLENLPFGGTKDSGMGREGVRYAMDEMTETKTLIL